MIADDIKIAINCNQTRPDGACIHKKGTVTQYRKKQRKINVPSEDGMTSPSNSQNRSTLQAVLRHHVGSIFVTEC